MLAVRSRRLSGKAARGVAPPGMGAAKGGGRSAGRTVRPMFPSSHGSGPSPATVGLPGFRPPPRKTCPSAAIKWSSARVLLPGIRPTRRSDADHGVVRVLLPSCPTPVLSRIRIRLQAFAIQPRFCARAARGFRRGARHRDPHDPSKSWKTGPQRMRGGDKDVNKWISQC
jgi:hypothetical protein